MKRLFIIACMCASACAHTNMKEVTCPGTGGETVFVEPSKAENEYLARTSERARGLAKCAKQAVHEATED